MFIFYFLIITIMNILTNIGVISVKLYIFVLLKCPFTLTSKRNSTLYNPFKLTQSKLCHFQRYANTHANKYKQAHLQKHAHTHTDLHSPTNPLPLSNEAFVYNQTWLLHMNGPINEWDMRAVSAGVESRAPGTLLFY